MTAPINSEVYGLLLGEVMGSPTWPASPTLSGRRATSRVAVLVRIRSSVSLRAAGLGVDMKGRSTATPGRQA